MNEIVILSTVHHYQDARIFFKEIPSLKKKYSNIIYIVSADRVAQFVENGIRIDPLPIPKTIFERIKLQKIVWRKVRKLKPLIIHFHDPELIILCFLIKKFLNVKIIFDIHENISASIKDKMWIQKNFRGGIAKLYSFLESHIIKSFDGLIIAEKSYKKHYGTNAIEILNYPLLKENNHTVNKDFNTVINFVYVGKITELRGIFVMLKIFKVIAATGKNVKLFLIGPYSPLLLEGEVEKFIKNNNLEKRVIIFGQKPIHEVYNILEDAHIGFAMLKPIGNYIESCPTKIFDYMINGIPVVVSDFDIYDEYVTLPITGIKVRYGDIENSAKKIIEILDDKEKLKIMSDNGVILTTSKWNWLSQEKKLLNLYEDILNGH